jgi:hypothetical protein
MARKMRLPVGQRDSTDDLTVEPFGHRGHPTKHENTTAKRLAVYIERAVRMLNAEGFTEMESVIFIAGVAFEKAAENGETWTSPSSARDTVINLMEGRAAKAWSSNAITLALWEIGALMQK